MKKAIEDKMRQGTYRPDRDNAQDAGDFIDKLPVPPAYWGAVPRVKKIYREIGNQLLEMKNMKSFDKYALLMLADAIEEYIVMTEIMSRKEKEMPGSGSIQTFKNGTSNVSTEHTVRERAFKRIMQVGGKFGMTVQDRVKMNLTQVDSGQMSIFDFIDEPLRIAK
jgi:P27 family predicted phage terminase small subunit